MLSKLERAFLAAEALDVLCCPHCGGRLERQGNSLVCARGHRHDMNRKGYLDLLSRPVEGCYDAALFEARSLVLERGCYERVAEAIASMLPEGCATLLDAGCGEGWYLDRLLRLRSGCRGIGIDISKDAIRRAAMRDSDALWCVADLRRIPVRDGGIDAAIDVLTPASYEEFRRVLSPEGMLIKVYPGSGYLREIREARGLPLYEEGRVDAYLKEHAQIVRQERVTAQINVDAALWRAFVWMTPLDQDLSAEEKEALSQSPA